MLDAETPGPAVLVGVPVGEPVGVGVFDAVTPGPGVLVADAEDTSGGNGVVGLTTTPPEHTPLTGTFANPPTFPGRALQLPGISVVIDNSGTGSAVLSVTVEGPAPSPGGGALRSMHTPTLAT